MEAVMVRVVVERALGVEVTAPEVVATALGAATTVRVAVRAASWATEAARPAPDTSTDGVA